MCFKKGILSQILLNSFLILAVGCGGRDAPTPDAPSDVSDDAPDTELVVGEFISISPEFGLIGGGDRVKIRGKNFKPGMKVLVGGSTCAPIDLISSNELDCTLGARNAAGKSTVEFILNGRSYGEFKDKFTYLSTFVVPYANSDAEVLNTGFRISKLGVPVPAGSLWRIIGGGLPPNWIDEVDLRGIAVDITRPPSSDAVQSYTIRDNALAARVSAYLGLPFANGDILSLWEINQITDIVLRDAIREDLSYTQGAGPGGGFVVHDAGFQLCLRPFMALPLLDTQAAYKTQLENELNQEIRRKGRTAPDRDAYLNVNRDSGRGRGHWLFFRLMDAIYDQDQAYLIDTLSDISAEFGEAHAGARVAFLDSFLTVFITKRFPSPALRDSYFHFILRCGQIHS